MSILIQPPFSLPASTFNMMRAPIVAVVLFLIGCENSFTPEYTLAWEPPVINQLIDTRDLFPRPEVTFGLPVWKYNGSLTTINFEEIQEFYMNSNPIYTGKSNESIIGSTAINFTVPNSEHVRISVLPARLPNENPDNIMAKFNASTLVKIRSGGIVLFDEAVEKGSYSVTFDPVQYRLPTGFYIYMLESNDGLSFSRTFYIYHSCEEIHPDILDFVSMYTPYQRNCLDE
jgi:hypothetical protein